MEHDDFICPVCYQCYDDTERAPRMVPVCGHTICTKCISQLLIKIKEDSDTFFCPEDRAEFPVVNRDINLFPKNYALLKLNEKRQRSAPSEDKELEVGLVSARKGTIKADEESCLSILTAKKEDKAPVYEETASKAESKANTSYPNDPSFNSTICREHNRKLELVCLDHKCRICANCALFGSHKNHDFRTEEEVLKEVACRAECLIDMFQIIDSNQNKMQDPTFIDQLNSKLRGKYDVLSSQVQEKFNAFINQVRIQERKVLEEISQKISDMEEYFKDVCKLPIDLNDKANRWKSNAQQKLASLSEKTERGEIAFEILEDRYNIKGDILSNGEKICLDLEKANEKPAKSLDDILKSLSLKFSDTFATTLQNFCTVSYAKDGPDQLKYDLAPQIENSPRRKVIRAQTVHEHPPQLRGNNSQGGTHQANISGLLNPPSYQGSFLNGPTNTSFSKACRMSGFNDDMNLLNFESNQFNLLDFSDHLIDSKRESGHLQANSNEDTPPHKNTPPKQNFIGKGPSLSNFEAKGLTEAHHASNLGDITNIPHETSSFNPEYRKTVGSIIDAKEDLQVTIIQEKKRGTQSMVPSDQEEISKMKSSGIISQTPSRNTTAKRKTASLKVNIKFEPIVDGLKAGTLENVDLTGAELGDIGVANIVENLAENKKLKSLKLLRNKITDEGAAVLIKNLVENTTLTTLNLTQNLLTDKTIDAFLNLFKVNSTIKTIYLNQNSIKTMNVKAKIKDMQKLGINVSI